MKDDHARVVICFPARNEEENITQVLDAIAEQTLMPVSVVIADDGSTDKTADIISSYDFTVLNSREKREKTVVGKIEMAKVWNDSITPAEHIHEEKLLDYILFLGGDVILPPTYVEKMVNKFETDPNVMVAAGLMEGEHAYKSTGFMVPGPGRTMRYQYWLDIGGKYPLKQGWESYPVYRARMEGYWTGIFDDIPYYPMRPTGGRTDYNAYGQAMKALGYFTPFALGRMLKQPFMKGRGLSSMINMFRGYFFGKPEFYEDELRDFIRNSQKRRLRKLFLRY